MCSAQEIFGAPLTKCICVLQLIVDDLELFPEVTRQVLDMPLLVAILSMKNQGFGFVIFWPFFGLCSMLTTLNHCIGFSSKSHIFQVIKPIQIG